MMSITHPLADDYLRRLEHASRTLPSHERRELVAEIRDHLETGLRPNSTEAEVRNFLDELGTPADIVAAARPSRTPTRRGAREVLAILFLLVGFFVLPIVGWVVGAALLLSSSLWTARQKLLGLLVWPGGLGFFALAELLGLFGHVDGVGIWIPLVVPPLVVAAYLYRAAGRNADAT
jgi:hypothetical protein